MSETTPKRRRGRPSKLSEGSLNGLSTPKKRGRPSKLSEELPKLGRSEGLQRAMDEKIEKAKVQLHFGTFLDMFSQESVKKV
jgi:transposase